MVHIFKGFAPWPSASKQIAMLQEAAHLSTVSSETREDLLNTKEDEKKKPNESEKGEKSEKSEKAKAKAKAKKSRLRANQAARADVKGKGKAIQIEPDWKSKSQIFADMLFGPKNDEGDGDDDEPDAPTQYTVGKFLKTISKRGIALPEEAQPNKPSSSETPFPYPDNFIDDFVLAFERSNPGGTKDIRDFQSHLWNHEGELGRILDLFELNMSHRQAERFNPFTQDGVVKRKLFRMTDLPPNVIRQIFKHVLVPADVVIPYHCQSDPIGRPVLHATGALVKPDTNVLVAFCSKKRAIAAVCDEARNVLYNENAFLFREPRDFIHFVGAVGWENLTRLNFDRSIIFSHDFFQRANEDEYLWLHTTGVKVASDMLGLRSWSGGWEEVDGAAPTPEESAEGPLWYEGEAFENESDGNDTVTPDRHACDAIGLAVTTPYTRPYTDAMEGTYFSARNLFHVDRADRNRALGRYNDEDGLGWYNVEYWEEKKCSYRWYEEETVGKGGEAAAAAWKGGREKAVRRVGREKASVRLGLRKEVSEEEREQLRAKGRKIREEKEEEDRRRGLGREWRLADVEEVEEEEEGEGGEEERPESPVTVVEVGRDEEERDHDSDSSSSTSTSIIEGWSTAIEAEILALMEHTLFYP